MGEYRIDYSKLTTYRLSLLDEKNNLIQIKKNFDNSYIGISSNEYLKKIKYDIDATFITIETAYTNINKWMESYLSTVYQNEDKYYRMKESIKQRELSCVDGIRLLNEELIHLSSTSYKSKNETNPEDVVKIVNSIIENPLGALSTGFKILNSLDEIYMKTLSDKYGDNTASLYAYLCSISPVKKQIQSEYDEIKKEFDTINAEIAKYNNQLNSRYNNYNILDYKTKNNSELTIINKKLTELRNKRSEIEVRLKEKGAVLTEINYYAKEAKRQFELSKFTYITDTDDYKTFKTWLDKQDKTKISYPEDKNYLTEEQLNVLLYYIYTDKLKLKNGDISLVKENDFLSLGYYELLKDDINKAKGAEAAAKWIKNYELNGYDEDHQFESLLGWLVNGFNSIEKGIVDGVDSFITGIGYVFDWSDEISSSEYEKIIIAQYLEENTEFSGAYQFSSSIGNMLPSIAASAAISIFATPAAGTAAAATLGSVVGSGAMGLSAGGNAKHQALVNGASKSSALLYGMVIGGSETLLGYFLGKMPFLGKSSVKFATESEASRAVVKETFKQLFSEGLEEASQEVIDMFSRKIILNEEINISELPGNMWQSFYMGIAMAAFMGGAEYTGRYVIDGITYKVKTSNLVEAISNGKINSDNDIKNLIIKLSGSNKEVPNNNANNYSNIFNDYNKNNSSSKGNLSDIFVDFMKNNKYNRFTSILVDNTGAINFKSIFGKENILNQSEYIIPYNNCNKVEKQLIKGWNSNFKIDKKVGLELENIFSDSNYVYGIHRTSGDEIANAIYNEGLLLTGHSMQGVVNENKDIDLNLNISFEVKNNEQFRNASLFRDISTSSAYKNSKFDSYGYGMVIKIPKEYVEFDANGSISDFKNIDNLIDNRGKTPKLKPEYIVGKVEVLNGDIIESKNTTFKTSIKTDSISNNYNTNNESLINETEIQQKMDRYNSLLSVLNNNADYKYWLSEIDKGHTISPSSDFIKLRQELMNLEKQILSSPYTK